MCSDQEHASDKVVPEDGDEQVLIAKHIQRFQVSKFS